MILKVYVMMVEFLI